MTLKEYLDGLTPTARGKFAKRCGVSRGHLTNVAYGYKPCTPGLAIQVERETDGKVPCEETCPDTDWAYLRGTAKQGKVGEPEARKAIG